MNTGLPYRAPSVSLDVYSWDRSVRYRGGCFRNWRISESTQPVLLNTTRVDGYLDSTPVPPYEREDTAHSYGDANANCHAGAKKCGPWTKAEFTALNVCRGTASHDVDCYETLSDVFNGALCQKAGFKAVQGRRVWHGDYAFKDPDRPQNWGLLTSATPPGCNPSGTPSKVKYLTKTFSIHVHGQFTMNSADGSAQELRYDCVVDQTWTINPDTGIKTLSGCTPPYVGCTSSPDTAGEGCAIGYQLRKKEVGGDWGFADFGGTFVQGAGICGLVFGCWPWVQVCSQ